MAIVIPLVMMAIINPLLVLFLTTLLPKLRTKRWPKGYKPVPQIIEEQPSSFSPGNQINCDFENDPEFGPVGVFTSLAEQYQTAGHNSSRDDWTFNPAYFTRRLAGSIRSKVSNIYHSIRSIASIRRPTIKHYLQNAKDAAEVQGLLDSDTEGKTENDNEAFEAWLMDPYYPQTKMTKITMYDNENTKEERVQKNCQDFPYSFTSFRGYNESVQGSCPSADSCTVSIATEEDTPEEMWQKVGGKDYDNMPSTSETPTDDSNTRNNDSSHSYITPENSLHADMTSDKSVDEMNGRICSEGNSEHDYQKASQPWVPLQSKDYSDGETKPVKSDAEDNENDGDISTQPTTSFPSSLLPNGENPSKETIPVNRKMSNNDSDNQYEPFNNGEKLDNFLASGNMTDDYPLVNIEPANEITQDKMEARSNKQLEDRNQLWKSQIASEINDEDQTIGPNTVASDFANFADTRRGESEHQWQLRKEVPAKGSEKIPDIVKPLDNDDVCITVEEENKEMQDNKTWNVPGPSFQSGPSLKQPPSVDSNKYDLSVADVPDTSEILKSKKTLNQPDNKDNIKKIYLKLPINEDPGKSSVSVVNNNGTDNEAEEIYVVDNSPGSSDTHYEKLNKSNENPQYAELFPPNMQDILDEMPDSAENILEFSRAEMERSEPDDGYTGDSYDDEISGYL